MPKKASKCPTGQVTKDGKCVMPKLPKKGGKPAPGFKPGKAGKPPGWRLKAWIEGKKTKK